MKKFISILLAVAFALTAFAALTSTTRFYRFQCDPQFNAQGQPISAVVQAFEVTAVNDGAAVVATSVKESARWDAVALKDKTVTYAGNTYTYGEVLGVILAIAAQEKAALANP